MTSANSDLLLEKDFGLTRELKPSDQLIKRLKAIEDITDLCSSSYTTDLNTFLERVLEPFCELTGADYGLVVLLSQPEDLIWLSATYGFPKQFSDNFNNKLSFKFNTSRSYEKWPSIKSMSNKQIVLIRDTNHTNVGFSRFFSDAIGDKQVKAVASVPLIINNKAVGALTKYYTEPHVFDSEEISFMKTTANIITSTIEKNQLLETATNSERELALANDELRQVNRELDSFVYIASHDLREPLRTIESFVSILEERVNDRLEDTEKDFLERIVKATHRMRRLIQDLTNLSRASREVKEDSQVIDLNVVLTEVQFELTAMIESSGARVICPYGLPKIIGNSEKLSSVFKNLISNAIKFNKSETPTVEIALEEEEDPSKVYISIRDNGIGISKEYHEKIFGLFQRLHTQEDYEGTGAGLAIVKKILEKYNCTLWVKSEEDKGSTFYFTLPRSMNDDC